MTAARVHLVVRGRVQGVGFRWYLREEARRLGVAGWVRNRSDGSVELEAAGDDGSLTQLGCAAERGPKGAEVAGVDRLPPSDDGQLPYPFTIEQMA